MTKLNIESTDELLALHERYADNELKGRFTAAEWSFLADSLNGTITDGDFRFLPSALVAHNEDSQKFDGTADKWGIDLSALNAKVSALTASQTEALFRRVEGFWENSGTVKLEDWVNY